MRSETAKLPRPGDVIAAKYRVERQLGAGGMGTVFEVLHRVTGKRFAVKWLLPELSTNEDAVQRFVREAQVAGRFDHPNVVEVYDIGQERGSLFMVMELLRGEALSSYLARARSLSVQECAEILLPCISAVARAHRAGIIHRDLKPANIFLCRAADGSLERPKVLDFGISKISATEDLQAHHTIGGIVMGTPHYMAPEQLRGKEIDGRVDVYAFGVLMYQLLSGELPFPADSYAELVVQVTTGSPRSLAQLVPSLPSGCVELVRQAMARSADDRIPSLDVLGEALAVFGGGSARGSVMPSMAPASSVHAGPWSNASSSNARPGARGAFSDAPPPRGITPAKGLTPMKGVTPVKGLTPVENSLMHYGKTPGPRHIPSPDKTEPFSTPLVGVFTPSERAFALFSPERLPWLIAALAVGVAALVTTLLILRSNADSIASPVDTIKGTIIGTPPPQPTPVQQPPSPVLIQQPPAPLLPPRPVVADSQPLDPSLPSPGPSPEPSPMDDAQGIHDPGAGAGNVGVTQPVGTPDVPEPRDRVIGPWRKQRLPGRKHQGDDLSDTNPATDNDNSPQTEGRYKWHKHVGPNNVRMHEKEF